MSRKTSMSTITIGKLAKSAGVKVDTVRYYGRMGLLPPLTRSNAGYRIYDDESVNQLRFIRKAQSLGFTLEEIKALLSLSERNDVDCGDIRDRAGKKIVEIEKKIADLQRMKNGLAELSEYCPGKGKPLSECGILRHFYTDEG